jgi:hypothetical protein
MTHTIGLQGANLEGTIFVGAHFAASGIDLDKFGDRLMSVARVTRSDLLSDRQGKTFADVLNDPAQPFEVVLEFFNDPDRQRRMEESELHHDRSPLAGVVRELEALPAIDQFFAGRQTSRNTRFRQAIGVLVRLIMERRGWRKTGRKGSLGVRASDASTTPAHNTGGLAFWFVRAERYEPADGIPYRSVQERCREFENTKPQRPARNGKRISPS